MQYNIHGDNMPVVICSLDEGESMICEAGAMSWMSPNMEMQTSGGGMGKMLGRLFSGEALMQNRYTAKGEPVDEVGEAIPETMLVFCGIGEALLNQVLEVIRVAKLPPISLKAVLTETNKDWTTKQLYEELCREREEFAMQTGEE